MSRFPRRGRVAAGALYAAATVLLLWRMRHELLAHGQLSPVTVAWMYATYGTHTAATSWTLYRGGNTMRLPRAASRVGSVLTVGGTGLYLAGIRRFAGPGQLSGTHTGSQITGGIYR